MNNAERAFTLAYAGCIAAYNACASRIDFKFAVWFAMRDFPGVATKPSDLWLASYYVFLLALLVPFVALLIRDFAWREYLSPKRRFAWLIACAAFPPLIAIYIACHGWWNRERGFAGPTHTAGA